jgi:hypothetical protein
LALALGVNETTLGRWRSKHKEFLQAYKEGAEFSDRRVEASYYQRAVGYEYASEKLFSHNGRIIRATIIEHVPPSEGAGEFWLRNRQPERWKDLKQLETSTSKDDPFTAYLRSINGCILRPVDPSPVIEGEYGEVPRQAQLTKREDVAPPPRPIADE